MGMNRRSFFGLLSGAVSACVSGATLGAFCKSKGRASSLAQPERDLRALLEEARRCGNGYLSWMPLDPDSGCWVCAVGTPRGSSRSMTAATPEEALIKAIEAAERPSK